MQIKVKQSWHWQTSCIATLVKNKDKDVLKFLPPPYFLTASYAFASI